MGIRKRTSSQRLSLTEKSIPEWCAAEFLKTSLLLQTQQFSKCLIQKQRHSGKGPSLFQAQHSGTQLPPRSTTSVSSLFQKCHTYKIQKSKELWHYSDKKQSCECIHRGTELNTDSPADHLGKSTECGGGIQNGWEVWTCSSWNRAKYWPACWSGTSTACVDGIQCG